jgi:hypothetical protein
MTTELTIPEMLEAGETVSGCVESCLACYRICQQCISATLLCREPRRAEALRGAVECGAASLTLALLMAAKSPESNRAAGILLVACRRCADVARRFREGCWGDCVVMCHHVTAQILGVFPLLASSNQAADKRSEFNPPVGAETDDD